ncbi:2-succinyl-6-hydroxy-2,4-cyclohexadiene-1-carboxylate synthase [Oceanobacillus kapialis]|uniref:Putative 2-succinyl-6-hydroxy-2,4-cyclohexadiene-1-carboxylate synthase n=1 Tax=Oceanobacillus kapialis TaxID=481353 RepID=A0ABW5Q020_9BACI
MYYNIHDTMYWVEKTGSGPVLLLLHGFTGSTKTWDALVKKWKDNFTVVTLDLPGHGKTTTQVPITMEMCCRDLAALVQRLGIEKVNLLGYSMGGRTALSFACLYPHLVDKLILESASPGLPSEKERLERRNKDEQLARKLEREGVKAFVDFWEKIPLFSTQEQLPPDKRGAIRQERLLHSAEGLAMSLRFMGTGSQPSWWEHLTQLSIPTLLLVGGEDAKFKALNKSMHERLPQSDFQVVEYAGHALHVEESAIFGNIVYEFIISQEDGR